MLHFFPKTDLFEPFSTSVQIYQFHHSGVLSLATKAHFMYVTDIFGPDLDKIVLLVKKHEYMLIFVRQDMLS